MILREFRKKQAIVPRRESGQFRKKRLGKMVGQETEFEEMRDISRLSACPKVACRFFKKRHIL
jgi:hypothetical protein